MHSLITAIQWSSIKWWHWVISWTSCWDPFTVTAPPGEDWFPGCHQCHVIRYVLTSIFVLLERGMVGWTTERKNLKWSFQMYHEFIDAPMKVQLVNSTSYRNFSIDRGPLICKWDTCRMQVQLRHWRSSLFSWSSGIEHLILFCFFSFFVALLSKDGTRQLCILRLLTKSKQQNNYVV